MSDIDDRSNHYNPWTRQIVATGGDAFLAARKPTVRDYSGSPVEDTEVVLIDEAFLRQAEKWIMACEHCSEGAHHPFDQLLDSLTSCDPTKTEYLMCRGAKCPSCHRDVTEKTLVFPS